MIHLNHDHPQTLQWIADYIVNEMPYCDEHEIYYDEDDGGCPLCQDWDGMEV